MESWRWAGGQHQPICMARVPVFATLSARLWLERCNRFPWQRQPSFDKSLFSVQLEPASGGYAGSPASF